MHFITTRFPCPPDTGQAQGDARLKYRPEIDGLRSVAVVSVVLYHAGVTALSGGFAGVDVFFVISGFLITRIIAEETRAGRFSILRFYDRRARRILPALLVVMLATVPLAWAVMVPYQLEDFTQSIVATLVFASNLLFWKEADYFAADAALKPLLHTWSLAVEEQFYVVFPLLLLALHRLARRAILPILAGLALVSFAAGLVWAARDSAATFFLIQFRAWELLAGAMAALWMMDHAVRPRPVLAWGGLAMIVASFLVVHEGSLWPGPLTLLPVLGTVAILMAATATTGPGRLLAWEPMRLTGLISYSLYLWHLPLLVCLNIVYFGEAPASLRALAVAVSVVLSVLSWRFVEGPFRDHARTGWRSFGTALALAVLPLLAFGIAGVRSAGFQDYIIGRVPPALAGRVIDRDAEVAARAPVWDAVETAATAPFDDTGQRRVLILGDSLSGDLIVATGGHAADFPGTAFRRQRLDDPCMPVLTAWLAAGAAASDLPAGDGKCGREARAVITGGLLEAADEVVLAANWQPDTAEGGLALATALGARGKAVSIQGVAAFNDMASLSLRMLTITDPVPAFLYRNIRTKFGPVNDRFAAAAATSDRLRYLDKLGLYCDDATRTCDMLDPDGKPVLFDNAHATRAGIDVLSARIRAAGWFS